MTKFLFWQDPYQKEFYAKVLEINGNQLVLDQTSFIPKGGGLISDTGEINEVKVLEVTKNKNNKIYHIAEDVSKFKVGDTVYGKIDWKRRYTIMRMHTAEHLISSIIHKETGALITGNQTEIDKFRVDYNLENFDREIIKSCVDKANEIIQQGLDVKIYFMKREEALKIPDIVQLANAAPPDVEELRIVEIGNVDRQADGGVHVKNTREIGKMKIIKFENRGKNNRRVYYILED